MGGVLPARRSVYLQRKEEILLPLFSPQVSSINKPFLLFPQVKMPIEMVLFSSLWYLDQHFLGQISTFLLKTVLKCLKVKFCSRILRSLLTKLLHKQTGTLNLAIADPSQRAPAREVIEHSQPGDWGKKIIRTLGLMQLSKQNTELLISSALAAGRSHREGRRPH